MSPNPIVTKVIPLTISDGGSNTTFNGAKIIARNRTTGESIFSTASSNKAALDLGNLVTEITDGDVIEFNVTGNTYGSGTITIGKGASSLTITTADQSSTGPAISL